ncbi:MAG: sensor signal transduction histidine kinase protein [Candidatus Angelobacter sp.]|jgi:PAS domain S-box-containing protein|nr:sensor signal transduction histidine kinase protein [Candidatus Angelobacter sp.]
MSRFNPFLWRRPPVILRYGIAVLSVTVALILSSWAALHLQAAPVSLFLSAVMLAAWFGGVGPGLLAVVFSVFVFYYYILPPIGLGAKAADEIPRLLAFTTSTLVVGLLSAAQRSATESLRRTRDDLKGSVQELEMTNLALQAESGERKEAENDLRRSQAYLAEAQGLSHTGSFGWNASTNEIVWSEESFRIFKYDRTTQPTMERIVQRVHPEDAALVKQTIARASQDGKNFEHEYRLLMPDGSVKYVHVVAHSSRDESRNSEFVGAVMDVTAEKQAQEALRNSEQHWRDAFENNPTMYFMMDAAGTIMAVNPFGAEQLGYTVDELVGQPVLNIFYEPDREAVKRKVALCLEQLGRSMTWEFRKMRKDGSVVWVRETARGVLRSNDHVVLIACEDITEQKRAEEALRQAQADLAHVSRVTTMGELTASLAHEVNQPIAAAVTNANACSRWLAAHPPNLEEARAAAKRIVRDGTRAAEIISRIRLLFKKGAPVRELVDLNHVIREMVVLLRGEATRYSISVRTELAADLPQPTGDRVQLQQVMMNLFMNSIEAMKEVDEIRELAIKSQRTEDEQILVSVRDTGVGLPPEQADKVFDAFFSTKPQGTGMGLSISRSIVESHGGRLWAAENSQRGASFCFTLPTNTDSHE